MFYCHNLIFNMWLDYLLKNPGQIPERNINNIINFCFIMLFQVVHIPSVAVNSFQHGKVL